MRVRVSERQSYALSGDCQGNAQMPAGLQKSREGRLSARVRIFLVGNGLRVEAIHARCSDEECPHCFRLKLPGGAEGRYHPDFYVSSWVWLEVKSGVGYNLDTLYRIVGAAAKAGKRYVVVSDRPFVKAFARWRAEVPELSTSPVRILTFPTEQENLLKVLVHH